MQLITVPHQTLRTEAKPITKLDKKLMQFIKDLTDSLEKQDNPKGVGLAANQVNKPWRIFAARLIEQRGEVLPPPTIFINPQIIKHAPKRQLGPTEKDAELEGCLSIPKLYGPVPRWPWIEVEYQEIVHQDTNRQIMKSEESDFQNKYKNNQHDKNQKKHFNKKTSSIPTLVKKTARFNDFTARILQHEIDHLNAVLFTDHILKYNLPLYKDEQDKLVEIEDKSFLKAY